MNWSESFNNAVSYLLDALSYVDEFDANTFMSSVFTASPDLPAYSDDASKEAGRQAQDFLNKAHSLINALMTYHPDVQDATVMNTWWTEEVHYTNAVRLLDFLQRNVVVLTKLSETVKSLPGKSFSTARLGLSAFKNECTNLIYDLNRVIDSYNRYADKNHLLNTIILPK